MLIGKIPNSSNINPAFINIEIVLIILDIYNLFVIYVPIVNIVPITEMTKFKTSQIKRSLTCATNCNGTLRKTSMNTAKKTPSIKIIMQRMTSAQNTELKYSFAIFFWSRCIASAIKREDTEFRAIVITVA